MKHQARKRFGQHFLTDSGVIHSIVHGIQPQPGDVMVEIGPGLSALTEPLVDRLDHLHVVEIDRDLAARLRKRYPASKLTVHEADALQFDFGALAQGGALRLVGNLPYNISSPLLFHLVQYAQQVRDQHFMLQKEVVERMVGAPGSRAYGRLSVMLQVHYEMENLMEVPPEAFEPAPQVDSAIVRMHPKAVDTALIHDFSLFERLVAQAFSQRRKMLRNTLSSFDAIVPLAQSGLSPTARAEDIAWNDFARYANRLFEAGVR